MQKPRCASVQDSHDRNKGPLLDEPRNPFIRTRTSNRGQELGVGLLGAYLGGKRVERSPVFFVGPAEVSGSPCDPALLSSITSPNRPLPFQWVCSLRVWFPSPSHCQIL